MYELGNLKRGEILQPKFEMVLASLMSYCYIHNNKTIIYNTNYSWHQDYEVRRKLYKIGFRQIGSYIGCCGDKVYILLKKIKEN